MTLSVVLLTGYLGQISLMQWAAAGVGGFIGGALAATDHWPMIPAILVAAIVAFAIGAVIALPMLRIRGMDVAIVTLGAGIAIQDLLIGQFWGVSGLTVPAPDLFGTPLTSREFLYVAEVILAIVILALWFARRGVVGQKLLAIRGSERAAAACGIRLPPSKVITFGLASAIAAVGGALFAFGSTTIETAGFDPVTSVEILAFCFINGVGSISGAVMVGFAIALGPIFLQNILHVQDTSWFIIVGGVATIWTLIRHPDGALGQRPRQTERCQHPARCDRSIQIWNGIERRCDTQRGGSSGRSGCGANGTRGMTTTNGLALLEVSDVRVRFGAVTRPRWRQRRRAPGHVDGRHRGERGG